MRRQSEGSGRREPCEEGARASGRQREGSGRREPCEEGARASGRQREGSRRREACGEGARASVRLGRVQRARDAGTSIDPGHVFRHARAREAPSGRRARAPSVARVGPPATAGRLGRNRIVSGVFCSVCLRSTAGGDPRSPYLVLTGKMPRWCTAPGVSTPRALVHPGARAAQATHVHMAQATHVHMAQATHVHTAQATHVHMA